MKIEHVEVWEDDVELMRDFYVRFFDGKANKLINYIGILKKTSNLTSLPSVKEPVWNL